jgi:starch-binding outer membrane protein, SusD/RagB family
MTTMHLYKEGARVGGRARLAASAIAICAVLVAGGCVDTPTAILSVQDPDIINPGDVQSPAGANAVRIGAIGRLNSATSGAPSGGEGLIQLSGMLADEWRSGDTFIDRDEIDRRDTRRENTFLTGAVRLLHRARLSGEQAVGLMKQYMPTAPGWQLAEMYFVQAYAENLFAEYFCNGVVFSDVVNGVEQYGAPMTTTEAFTRALAHADSALLLITGTTVDDIRVRSALQTARGRILMNLDQSSNAAAAVTAVLTTFRYRMYHAQTTNDNAVWALNNSLRRYNVSGGEGGVGIDFVTPNDPRLVTCAGGSAACTSNGITGVRTFDNNTTPAFRAQLIWPARDSSVFLVSGIEARLIEAENQVRSGAGTGGTYLSILNTLRATVTGLAALTDPGADPARINQVFRERAFWLFGRGHRLGDLRRLIRQHGRTESSVFPNGPYHKGGNYGSGVNFPLPQAEDNNPKVLGGGCTDRSA